MDKELGVSKQYLIHVVSGVYRSLKNEERIAAYLGVPREELFPAWNRSGNPVLSAGELAELKAGLSLPLPHSLAGVSP